LAVNTAALKGPFFERISRPLTREAEPKEALAGVSSGVPTQLTKPQTELDRTRSKYAPAQQEFNVRQASSSAVICYKNISNINQLISVLKVEPRV
jgi:hypothetical protein